MTYVKYFLCKYNTVPKTQLGNTIVKGNKL